MRRGTFVAGVLIAVGAIRFPSALLDPAYRADVRANDSTVMEVVVEGTMGRREVVVEFERFGSDVRSTPFFVEEITDEVSFHSIDCPDLGVKWDVPQLPALMPGDVLDLELRIENSTRWDFSRLAGKDS